MIADPKLVRDPWKNEKYGKYSTKKKIFWSTVHIYKYNGLFFFALFTANNKKLTVLFKCPSPNKVPINFMGNKTLNVHENIMPLK